MRAALPSARPRMLASPRHPGMPCRNDGAKQAIREGPAKEKRSRRQLGSASGMRCLAVTRSVLQTGKRRGIWPARMLEAAVANPNWNVFDPSATGPPPPGKGGGSGSRPADDDGLRRAVPHPCRGGASGTISPDAGTSPGGVRHIVGSRRMMRRGGGRGEGAPPAGCSRNRPDGRQARGPRSGGPAAPARGRVWARPGNRVNAFGSLRRLPAPRGPNVAPLENNSAICRPAPRGLAASQDAPESVLYGGFARRESRVSGTGAASAAPRATWPSWIRTVRCRRLSP